MLCLYAGSLRILLLKKRDGKSVDEIADELGYSAHTVKKYLAQALASCRMQINELDEQDAGHVM